MPVISGRELAERLAVGVEFETGLEIGSLDPELLVAAHDGHLIALGLEQIDDLPCRQIAGLALDEVVAWRQLVRPRMWGIIKILGQRHQA